MNTDLSAEADLTPTPPPPSFSPTLRPLDGLHTPNTMLCADRSSVFLSASPATNSKITSPTPSHSGSSAQTSSVCTDEDISERNHEFQSPIPSTSAVTLEAYSSIAHASPIYAPESPISYGADRLVFVEQLIWDCVAQVASIYDGMTNEPKPPAGASLESLVHEGIIHGLCNEIVILPVMAAIQKCQGVESQHQADMIPFPLFVAEILRRMRASYFLFRIAMRYMLDIEPEVRAARQRANCGWCRSGARGCDHSRYSDPGTASRFSRGRSAITRKPRMSPGSPLPASHFIRSDPLAPLSDPRKAFLGALILANKFHRDRSIGNKSWATLIGLSLEEVHAAERAVGQALGWSLSRPWVSKEMDETGVYKPGPIHPSFAEPLFATNDQEIVQYGIKNLREKGTLPPFLRLACPAFSLPLKRVLDAGGAATKGSPSPSNSLRRSRSQTPVADDRRIVPLPHRQNSLNQTLKPANPIKKASSAPFVLQPFTSGYADSEQPENAEMVDSIVQSEWNPIATTASAESWMEATPTPDQVGTKRKATEDFGPTPVARRGKQGQRIAVASPSGHSVAPTPIRPPDHFLSHWDASSHDESMSPGLSIGTPTTSSPSIGPLTRTNTPVDFMYGIEGQQSHDCLKRSSSRSSFSVAGNTRVSRRAKSPLTVRSMTRTSSLPA